MLSAAAVTGGLGILFWSGLASALEPEELRDVGALWSLVAVVTVVGGVGLGSVLAARLPQLSDPAEAVNRALMLLASAASLTAMASGLILLIAYPTLVVRIGLLAMGGYVILAFTTTFFSTAAYILTSVGWFRAYFFIHLAVGGARLALLLLPMNAATAIWGLAATSLGGGLVLVAAFIPRAVPNFRVHLTLRRPLSFFDRFVGTNYVGSILFTSTFMLVPVVASDFLMPRDAAGLFLALMLSSLLFTVPSVASQVVLSFRGAGVVSGTRLRILLPIACAVLGAMMFAGVSGAKRWGFLEDVDYITCGLLFLTAVPLAANALYAAERRVEGDGVGILRAYLISFVLTYLVVVPAALSGSDRLIASGLLVGQCGILPLTLKSRPPPSEIAGATGPSESN